MWHLPDSFESENLHGKSGTTHYHLNTTSQEDMSHSMQMVPSLSYSPHPKQTPFAKVYHSTYLQHLPHYALSEPSGSYSIPIRNNRASPSLPDQSAPSVETMSLKKSKNSCSTLESTLPASLAIPSARGPPSQQLQMAL